MFKNNKGLAPLPSFTKSGVFSKKVFSNSPLSFCRKNEVSQRVMGFTLVEMLVVVAIIAILSSVFLIGLRGFRGSAYDARRLSDLQKLQSYLEIYYNQQRAYPDVTTWDALGDVLVDVGVSAIPNDPVAGGTYYYGRSEDGQSYVLGAKVSDPKSSALSEHSEIDGSVYGVNCDDPVYCVQF